MIRINSNYGKLQSSYLFSTIARKVQEFQASHPEAQIIRLGIGDVTKPLPQSVITAFHSGVDDMADESRFRGYGPEQGYEFLRSAIAQRDFKSRGISVDADEIFVSDGAKSDTGNFQDLFATDIRIALPDPVYPVYVDTNVMAGRTGMWDGSRYAGLTYLPATKENSFVPEPPSFPVDLIYLCFPNNPTGTVATKRDLQAWVEYAVRNRALILFDAAYEEFVRDPSIPRSIYEIEGAREVAIEFRSLSKTAGFTGTRLGYTIIPKDVKVYDENGQTHSLRDMWNRRQTTKTNGVSYPVQRAAEAVFSDEGQKEIHLLSDYYLGNAATIRKAWTEMGFESFGGVNSPYVWVHVKRDSWEFFDEVLNKAAIVTTPGVGFGSCGSGFIRISAFNDHAKVVEAMARLSAIFR